MIGTKCRVPFLQYMPKKPTKWGIKVWMRADAKNCYVTTFSRKDNDDNSGKQLAHCVVIKLLQSYLGKHYNVYFDNFYTSPKLVVDLLKNKTYCSGTVCSNGKEFPKDIGPRLKLCHGSIVFRACGSLEFLGTALQFTDTRDVYYMWHSNTVYSKAMEWWFRRRGSGNTRNYK